MKYQIMFSGKKKKNIIQFASVELGKRVVKVKFSADDILKYFFLYFFSRKRVLTVYTDCVQ